MRANPVNRATPALTQLLELTFGPQTVIAEGFATLDADQVVVFGFWADRYHGTPGQPPNDIDVLVVGAPDRGDVYDAADRAQVRLGIEVNPVIRTARQWAEHADPLVQEIKASPSVTVAGRRADAPLRGGHAGSSRSSNSSTPRAATDHGRGPLHGRGGVASTVR